MTKEYFKFLKFFSDGHWIWADRFDAAFDFAEFISTLDFEQIRKNHHITDPPTAEELDCDYVYQFGTYELAGNKAKLTFRSNLADMDVNLALKISGDGEILSGLGGKFKYKEGFSKGN